jgi:hypothetical protein
MCSRIILELLFCPLLHGSFNYFLFSFVSSAFSTHMCTRISQQTHGLKTTLERTTKSCLLEVNKKLNLNLFRGACVYSLALLVCTLILFCFYHCCRQLIFFAVSSSFYFIMNFPITNFLFRIRFQCELHFSIITHTTQRTRAILLR